MALKVLALDMERTLIVSERHPQPRPGLKEFLQFCRNKFPRVVIYTGVDNDRAREILEMLARQGDIPRKFPDQVDYIEWPGDVKDLRHIPNARPEEVLILDDYRDYILPEQRGQWIPVNPYNPPGINPRMPNNMQEEPVQRIDREFERLKREIRQRLEEEQ